MRRHLRCIGVPEHFNLPWHLAIENGSFQEAGATLLWNDEPKGTGAMCQALREGSTDMAVMVTTGTIRECLRNSDIKIVSCYVDSPLIWGVHVPASSEIHDLQSVTIPKFAISRFNSGSHLMAHYLAAMQGWKLSDSDFDVVHDLNGCRKAFESGSDMLFLWEKFTTYFLVDMGEFKRIDEITPDWPCFLIAARKEVLETNDDIVTTIVRTVSHEATRLSRNPNAIQMIAERYNLPMNRAESWFRSVQWSPTGKIDVDSLYRAMVSLRSVGMIPEADMSLIRSICWEYE